MTEELKKKAEEYYYKSVFAETNPKSETELKEKFLQTFQVGAEFGYNKANEWHDLRKDPNDLPKLDKTDMSNYVITDKGVAYYNGRVKSWYIQNEYILSDDVIAWCEIPTFDKE